MLGVVNWSKNGLHVLEVSTNDVMPYNLAFKSGLDAFYTVLRAGIIVGAGSASFELIRDLVEKLPVMLTPKWLNTRCQH